MNKASKKSSQSILLDALTSAGLTKEKLATTVMDANFPADSYMEDYAEFVQDGLASDVTAAISTTGLTKNNLAAVLAESLFLLNDVAEIVTDNPKLSSDITERCVDSIEEIFRDGVETAIVAAIKAKNLTEEDRRAAYVEATNMVQEGKNKETEENLEMLTLIPNVGLCELSGREKVKKLLVEWKKIGNGEIGDEVKFFSERFNNPHKIAGEKRPNATYVILFDRKREEWRNKILEIAGVQFGQDSPEYGTLLFYFTFEKSDGILWLVREERRQ